LLFGEQSALGFVADDESALPLVLIGFFHRVVS
jgi:hypothetical protein